jgi:serine/threonine-protein kinase
VSDADPDADAANDPMIGTVLASRYRIDARLGSGATGAVYRASHVKFGRQFAVKVLGDPTTDPKVLRRFEREAELGGKLRHPNVVSVVDVGETSDGTRFMVMELAIGIDLATVFGDDAPLSASRSIHLLRGLLEGLDHAHERGVIHRDFKPENVIIERDDHGGEVPRIVDFGIALAREDAGEPESTDRLTTTGLVLGTPHYMAPEQATASAMDHRIDLFALGVVAYEMLAGVMPYDGSGVEVARANMTQPTPPMWSRAPGAQVDPLLEAFAARLMAKNPDARPPTAKAARELLDLIETDRAAAAALLGLPVEAASAQPVPTGKTRRAETVPDPVLLARRAGKPPPSWLTPPGTPAAGTPPPGSVRADTQVGPAPAPVPAPAPALAASAPRADLVRAPIESEPIAATSSGNRTRLAIAIAVALVVVVGGVFIATRPPKREAPAPKRDAGFVVTLLPDAAVAEPPPLPPPPPVDAAVVAVPEIDAAVVVVVAPSPDAAVASRPVAHVDAAVVIAALPHDASVPAPAPDAAAPATPSAQEIATQYADTGRAIKALSDAKGASAADDLWTRYRLIRLDSALASEAARRDAAATLAGIRRDLATRR